jgi:hypothetical protein
MILYERLKKNIAFVNKALYHDTKCVGIALLHRILGVGPIRFVLERMRIVKWNI